ncbi:MAG: D-alanyl-D-alanine carboxypeptidase [Oscillospiraceae bacterium]|jgi:D-alanyl-D-alanine carboxypeptidase|nr:D-alanyl-D-alanine carboxypeptidase [Oscillospiraceae bacterium]
MIKKILLPLLAFATLVTPALASAPVPPALISETAVLIDAESGQVLFQKDMHRLMRPASTTKVMTALLALENADLGDSFTMSEVAVSTIGLDAANAALKADEVVTMEQAVHALALVSAADACNGIAEYVGGTIENFVAMMNERAVKAGALHTNFRNTHGMPDEEHLTTAYDLAMIMRDAVATPGFTEIFDADVYEMPPTNLFPETRVFKSHNLMTSGDAPYDGALASKTGWTELSEHTLVTAAKRNGRTLIGVVMKSPEKDDKYTDMAALLDYGFTGFTQVRYSAEELSRDEFLSDNPEKPGLTASVAASEGFSCLIRNDQNKADIALSYHTAEGGELPVKVVFSLGYTVLGEVPVTAAWNIPVPAAAVPSPLPVAEGAEEVRQSVTADMTPPDTEDRWHPVLMWIAGLVIVVLGLCAVLAAVILVLRRINIAKYRGRHR